MNIYTCCCRVGKCTLLTIMQISDRPSVIGFFWWHQYRISVHAKNPYRYTSNRYITFTQGHTRSSTHNKLKHRLHSTNLNRNSYFHRLPRLWNALPVINTNLSIVTIKAKLKKFMWNHFVTHFDDDNHCTYHYLCPCSKCHDLSPPSNFQTL